MEPSFIVRWCVIGNGSDSRCYTSAKKDTGSNPVLTTNKLKNMKNEIKLSDLKQYDSMYWIGDIEPYSDGDGWVFEDEAVRILDEINKKNISNKK